MSKHYSIVNVFCVHGDGGEFGIGPIIGVYSSPIEAERMSKGKGWYGSNGTIDSRKAILTSDGKYWLLDEHFQEGIDIDDNKKRSDEKLKRETLASLTPEQKRVLNL